MTPVPALPHILLAKVRYKPTIALEEAAGDYARASKSACTRRAYQADAADFTAWCRQHGLEPLPAHVSTVAAYLAGLARAGLKASTIPPLRRHRLHTPHDGTRAADKQPSD